MIDSPKSGRNKVDPSGFWRDMQKWLKDVKDYAVLRAADRAGMLRSLDGVVWDHDLDDVFDPAPSDGEAHYAGQTPPEQNPLQPSSLGTEWSSVTETEPTALTEREKQDAVKLAEPALGQHPAESARPRSELISTLYERWSRRNLEYLKREQAKEKIPPDRVHDPHFERVLDAVQLVTDQRWKDIFGEHVVRRPEFRNTERRLLQQASAPQEIADDLTALWDREFSNERLEQELFGPELSPSECTGIEPDDRTDCEF